MIHDDRVDPLPTHFYFDPATGEDCTAVTTYANGVLRHTCTISTKEAAAFLALFEAVRTYPARRAVALAIFGPLLMWGER